MVDLETGVFKKIETYKYNHMHDYQLNGSLIAFKENYENPILRVIDANTGTEVYSRPIPPSYEYYLMEDKVFLFFSFFLMMLYSPLIWSYRLPWQTLNSLKSRGG